MTKPANFINELQRSIGGCAIGGLAMAALGMVVMPENRPGNLFPILMTLFAGATITTIFGSLPLLAIRLMCLKLPREVRLLTRYSLGALAAVLLALATTAGPQDHYWVEYVFGWAALNGLLAVAASDWMAWLDREEECAS